MISASLPSFIQHRGLMLALASPSGAGKTTISRRLLTEDTNVRLSISVTTRPQRSAEQEGVHYHFVKPSVFQGMVKQNKFLEQAKVFGNDYGTPREPVEKALKVGLDMLFDIDWQGTQQLAEKARADLVSVFILPPSWKELERRLHIRAQDSPEIIAHRMEKAASEMSHWAEYDYIIINHDLEDSVRQVKAILTAERLKRHRQEGLSDFVRTLQQERADHA